jgi:hypothetical protein
MTDCLHGSVMTKCYDWHCRLAFALIAPVAYSHIPLPDSPKVPFRCRIRVHKWKDVKVEVKRDSDGAVVWMGIFQKCQLCPKTRFGVELEIHKCL